MELKKYSVEMASILAGLSIIVSNYLVFPYYLPKDVFSFLQPMLNVVGSLIAVVPPVLVFYNRYTRNKEVERQFTVFIADFTGAIESGMTLPMALKYCGGKDYGVLTPQIRSINSQVEWGVPFKETLQLFSEKTQSLPVKRALTTIIETYKVGGMTAATLKAVGQSLMEINKIKAERSVSVQSQILTSYLIYFIFIFILVILQSFFIPALTPKGDIPGMVSMSGALPEMFPPDLFVNFIIVQGFFAGLATGKMAEGSLAAGMKHSIVLIVIGYSIFSLASNLKINLF
jgi:flagellar protein FlaJ